MEKRGGEKFVSGLQVVNRLWSTWKQVGKVAGELSEHRAGQSALRVSLPEQRSSRDLDSH